MSFELSDPPKYLEISHPSRSFETLIENTAQHFEYWLRAYQKSVAEVDLGMHALNETFTSKFEDLSSDLDPNRLPANRSEAREFARKHVADLLAVSGLARKIAEHPDITPKDARTNQKDPHILIDTYGIPSRFHLAHEVCNLLLPESDSTTQWYRDGDLFVRRITPPELSLDQHFALSYVSLQIDPANMATLYPYLGQIS